MAFDLITKRQSNRDWSLGADDKEARMKKGAERAKLHIAQKRDELGKRFDKPVPKAELVEMLESSLAKIVKMDESISGLEAHTGWGQERKAVRTSRQRLNELLVIARKIDGSVRPGTKTANEFRKWILSPYEITIAAIDHKGIPAYETIASVWELPASAATFVIETVKNVADKGLPALGLPKWFLPVTIGGVSLALIAGIYQNVKSYAPIGGHR